MRLRHVGIRNFKGVRAVEFPTEDAPQALHELTALLGDNHPGDFRAKLRDWIIANPQRALELLPEWQGLLEALRT